MRFWKPSLGLTKIMVSISLCLGSTVTFSSSAAACQAGAPGCVLPVRDPAPPPPPPPGAGPILEDGGGFGIWPFIIGLAALAALLYLLLSDGGDEDGPPVSP